MSRSTYIYVVRSIDGELVGAWTVKRELAAWLARNGHADPQTADAMVEVVRTRDGLPHGHRVTLNPRTLEPAA